MTGRISAYRAPGGAGIRLDEGSVYVGAEVSPYYDSLLLKVTARAHDFATAIARAHRAVDEVRVRGVSTNQAFLSALLDDPDFQAGRTYTTFVDEHPSLSRVGGRGDRASKLLRRLAEVTVNRPHGSRRRVRTRGRSCRGPPAATRLPARASGSSSSDRNDSLPGSAPSRRSGLLTPRCETRTSRCLATRMRTFDMLAAAPHIAHGLPELLSLEVWGGATFDVALRFLSEDPWQRLAALRERIPNVCLQMLLRGRNLLGYAPYPDAVVRAFVAEASATGVDIFRIFDALNNAEPMRTAIEATLECGAVAEAALCYTGDLSDPGERVYTLDYYLRIAEQLVDMPGRTPRHQGHGRPPARAGCTRPGFQALRKEFDLPVHLHTHDTAGGQLATYLAAIEAGVDAVDGAAAPLAGMTSQPAHGGHRRRHQPQRARDRGLAQRVARPRAVLGGRAHDLRSVRDWAARADGPGLSPPDPGRTALQPPPAGDRRSASATASKRSSAPTRERIRSSATSSR